MTISPSDDIKTNTLQLRGHVQWVDEGRLSEKIMKCRPKRLKTRVIPKLTWVDGIQNMIQKRLAE